MFIADWRHLDQLSIDELDAIVFSENAGFRQLVK